MIGRERQLDAVRGLAIRIEAGAGVVNQNVDGAIRSGDPFRERAHLRLPRQVRAHVSIRAEDDGRRRARARAAPARSFLPTSTRPAFRRPSANATAFPRPEVAPVITQVWPVKSGAEFDVVPFPDLMADLILHANYDLAEPLEDDSGFDVAHLARRFLGTFVYGRIRSCGRITVMSLHTRLRNLPHLA